MNTANSKSVLLGVRLMCLWKSETYMSESDKDEVFASSKIGTKSEGFHTCLVGTSETR